VPGVAAEVAASAVPPIYIAATISRLLEIQDRLVGWRDAPQQAEAAAQDAANLAAQLRDRQRANP